MASLNRKTLFLLLAVVKGFSSKEFLPSNVTCSELLQYSDSYWFVKLYYDHFHQLLYDVQNFDVRSTDVAEKIYRLDKSSFLRSFFQHYFEALGPLDKRKLNRDTWKTEAPPYPSGFTGTLKEMLKFEANYMTDYFLRMSNDTDHLRKINND